MYEMGWIEIISCFLICVLGTMTTISDFKEGLIRNKLLIWFLGAAVVLDVINYAVFNSEYIGVFFLNFACVSIISLILFYTHSFAGGDCKLMIVFAALYPATCCLSYRESQGTLILSLGLAIFYGYVYLLVSSIWLLIRKRNKITWEYIRGYIWNFLLSFVSAVIYLNIISIILMWINVRYVAINEWLIRIACISFAFLIGKKPILKKWFVIIPAFVLDLALCLVFGVYPISFNIENYILILTLLLCQMMIRTNLYEEIKVSDIKKGIILTTVVSMMMQNSRFKGLPGVSTEDLRDRLTEEEADVVKKWAKSRNIESISIVKKIPFALFIFMGMITYFVMWRVI